MIFVYLILLVAFIKYIRLLIANGTLDLNKYKRKVSPQKKTIIVEDLLSNPIKEQFYRIDDCYNDDFDILKALYMNWLLLKQTNNDVANQTIEIEDCTFNYDELSVSVVIKIYGKVPTSHKMKFRSDYVLKYPLDSLDNYNNLYANVKDRELLSLMENIHNNYEIIYPTSNFLDSVKRAYIAKQIKSLNPNVKVFNASLRTNSHVVYCFADESLNLENKTIIHIDSTATILYEYDKYSTRDKGNQETFGEFLNLNNDDPRYYKIILGELLKSDSYQDRPYTYFYRELLLSLVNQSENSMALFVYGIYFKDLDYLKRAADLNLLIAKYYIGLWYYNNTWVKERDYDIAFSYFKDAATNNFPPAFFMLGECLIEGRGVRKNIQLAGDCYKKYSELEYTSLIYGQAPSISSAKLKVDKLYTDGKWDKNNYDSSLSQILFNNNTAENQVDLNNKIEVHNYKEKYSALLKDGYLDEAAINLRKILEIIIDDYIKLYSPENSIDSIFDKINVLQKKAIFNDHESRILHKLRMLANRGAHNGEKLTNIELQEAIPWIDEIVELYSHV